MDKAKSKDVLLENDVREEAAEEIRGLSELELGFVGGGDGQPNWP